MDVFEGLQKLGLSQKETKVYLALLNLGEASVGKVSSRTGIHRRSCYDTLNSLQEKGLVSYSIIGRVKIYKSTGLSAFKAFARETQFLVEELLPLLGKKESRQEEPVIEIFRGLKSTKGVFEDLLDDGRTIVIYGGTVPARIYLKNYFPKFNALRKKLGVKLKALYVDIPGVRDYVKTLPLVDARFIDKKYFSPSFWWMQGETISLVFWREEPIIVRITDKSLAKTYLGSFNMLWKTAKK